MKEAVSATTIFQIVILFILLFTAIMCLTINNSNAFGIKDEIINIIEMNNGNYLSNDNVSLNEEIVEAIANNSYRTTGVCDSTFDGFERNGEPVSRGEKASVCIKKIEVTDGIDKYLDSILGSGSYADDEFVTGSYYQVVVFYQLDIPVIKQIYDFTLKGETKIIYLEERSTNGRTPDDHSPGEPVTPPTEEEPPVEETPTPEEPTIDPVCREGLVENPTIRGKQGVAMAEVAIFPTLQDAAGGIASGKTMDLNGTRFTILGNNGAADGSGWWAIMYNGECGWVDSSYMAINAASYLPSNYKFNITNASSSAYRGINGLNIPGLTGQKLYDSSFYNNSFVPITFPFALKLYNIGVNNSNRTFVINDAYRPYSVTRYAATTANKIPEVTAGFGSWPPDMFLALNVSRHNTGCAIDVTFGDLTSEQQAAMPSPMHELSTRATVYTGYYSNTYTSSFENSQAHVLHDIMVWSGLKDLKSEWWHYQDDTCYNTIRNHPSTNGGRNINFYANTSVVG